MEECLKNRVWNHDPDMGTKDISYSKVWDIFNYGKTYLVWEKSLL